VLGGYRWGFIAQDFVDAIFGKGHCVTQAEFEQHIGVDTPVI
jgi:hypothetical protein